MSTVLLLSWFNSRFTLSSCSVVCFSCLVVSSSSLGVSSECLGVSSEYLGVWFGRSYVATEKSLFVLYPRAFRIDYALCKVRVRVGIWSLYFVDHLSKHNATLEYEEQCDRCQG
jgi:hypothetical protein